MATAKLTIPGIAGDIELPILQGTEGGPLIDISKLNAYGVFTFDPGFTSTAACKSKITYIDGEKGILRYRGYDIADLAEKSTYMEVCYLLVYGELPNAEQYNRFLDAIKHHTLVHEQIHFMYRGFPRNSHPMAILAGAVNSLSAFYHEHLDINNPQHREQIVFKLVAKMPTLTAMAYKYSIGHPFIHPDNSLDYPANFLNMMFAVPSEVYHNNEVANKALDLLLILHADHEQNASTSAVRLAGSSGANPFAVMGAGIAALWGPAHGGANEAVIKMLEEIGKPERVPEYIARAKNKEDSFRLMGFGHRVYKNYDPRAQIIKKMCDSVLSNLKISDPLLDLAMALEQAALKDDYFIEKKLYPNVDFYSGIIYRALGIPTKMFTAMFALARTVGWISQWKEMLEDGSLKIGRPRQLYIGYTHREYKSNR